MTHLDLSPSTPTAAADRLRVAIAAVAGERNSSDGRVSTASVDELVGEPADEPERGRLVEASHSAAGAGGGDQRTV